MRVIKLGIISFVVFSFLITLISLFFPSHIRISRAIDINASKENVSHLINDSQARSTWYPIDSAKNLAGGFNIIETGIPNTITVQWYMDFHLGWLPWKKFSGLLLEKRYGPIMESGLERLKKATIN